MTGAGHPDRYERQRAFPALAAEGQRRLSAGRAAIIGVGGLGSMLAELLARMGVAYLRLVDDDRVSLGNIHRQIQYDEADAAGGSAKVVAAARRLARINSGTQVEPVIARLGEFNAEALTNGVDVILDGSDNFATRFVLNDVAVRHGRPWVFAGVVGAEGQVMAVMPGRACLRCVYPEPPDAATEAAAKAVGVLPTAVSAVAALAAGEAVKILAGRGTEVWPYLVKLDVWRGTWQRLVVSRPVEGCVCQRKQQH